MGGRTAIRCRRKRISHVASVNSNVGDAVPVEFRIGAGPVKTGSLPIRNTRTIGVDKNDIIGSGRGASGEDRQEKKA
jgi:hypothetical protein